MAYVQRRRHRAADPHLHDVLRDTGPLEAHGSRLLPRSFAWRPAGEHTAQGRQGTLRQRRAQRLCARGGGAKMPDAFRKPRRMSRIRR
jgi:hypothetical protein